MKFQYAAKISAILIVTGCGVEPGDPERISAGGAVVSRIELGRAIGEADLAPVGVTVDQNTGRRYIIDAARGLYEISVTGAATQRWDGDASRYGQALRSGFSDVASLGEDRFAITARSWGYLLDLSADTFVQHFCYLPGEIIDEDPVADQHTDALTYDPHTDRLLAQPQTFNSVTEALTSSQVSTFDPITGEDLDWLDVGELEFLAGGMASDTHDLVLLARGSEVFRYSLSAAERVKLPVDLAAYGLEAISGMAKDPVRDTFLFIDSTDNELVELRADAVR